MKENKNNLKKIRELIKELKNEQTQETSEKDEALIFFPGSKFVIRQGREKIRKAKKSVDAVLSFKCYMSMLAQDFSTFTKEATKRGVKYRLIIELPMNNIFPSEHMEVLKRISRNGGEVKYIDTSNVAIITICDNKEAFIFMPDKADLSDTPELLTNNSVIVSIVRGYFEYLWMTTKNSPKDSNNLAKVI